jgi:hydroxylamine reductase (hybrid-cluster protein)
MAREKGIENEKVNQFVFDALFVTITNANFDYDAIVEKVKKGLKIREEIKNQFINAGGFYQRNYMVVRFGQQILLKNLNGNLKLLVYYQSKTKTYVR